MNKIGHNIKGYSIIQDIESIGREAYYGEKNKIIKEDYFIIKNLEEAKIIDCKDFAIPKQWAIVLKIGDIEISNLKIYFDYSQVQQELRKEIIKFSEGALNE